MIALQKSILNPLGEPLRLASGLVLRNRLAKAAMSEALATYDNHPVAKHVELYRRWAKSGIGLLITGNVMIDRRALGEPGNVVIEDAEDLPLLKRWADAAISQGAAIWAQLNHPGKQSTKGLNVETVAPSAVPFREDMQSMFATPRELSAAEIEDLVRRFGRSAAVCKKAGFSGVQIHAAHGYLINQFLSPHHNQREDEWGGSAEKRRRFLLAVYAEIRSQVGPDFTVAVKINSADFQRGGFTEEDSAAAIKALADAGIDLIEISGGTYEDPAMSGALRDSANASTAAREAYFLEFAQKVRSLVAVPLMLTGGFRTAAGMNAALRSGALDVVGLARLLAIDPDAPAKLLRGVDSAHQVSPIRTGVKAVDRMGIMEVFWYSLQLDRMGRGKEPNPRLSGRAALFQTLLKSGWGTMRTQRMRPNSKKS